MSEIDWTAIREEEIGDFTLAALPPTLKLPALPHAVTLFVQKSNDPDARIDELARIVETDTGLTLELLRYVNSAYLGLRHKAKSVHQAIALLGLRRAKMFLISTGMKAAVEAKKSRLINQACFWNASLQKALFAKEVAKLLKTDAGAGIRRRVAARLSVTGHHQRAFRRVHSVCRDARGTTATSV
ncbi:MAG: HDOD domain-containing protein [Planctomycetes bacterium]|nr:HDOD domain-containing protein [Planctomycetota bacterium]